MNSLVDILVDLLHDCGRRCDAQVLMDIKTMSNRVENEGDSFLTITLPGYCKDFEKSLDDSQVDSSAFLHFRKRRGMPLFLGGFLSQIFDINGKILDEPSTDCILAVRQICLAVKKVLRPCTKQREQAAEDSFIKCEDEVNNSDISSEFKALDAVSRIVMSTILDHGFYEDLDPRHGPGATADRITGNGKFRHSKWHSRLDTWFPYTEFGLGSARNLFQDDLPFPDFIEPEHEQPVRVVFVPKTLKTPRVIAVEPVCMQYAQQALLRWLVPRIEMGKYTAGRVNFTNQGINKSLAKNASRTGKFATLDMSEASDRVSMSMATAIYKQHPDFLETVLACRSYRALLPSGKTITLKKFASMGSALCFPTEAMVFFCAIVAARLQIANLPVLPRHIYTLSRDVYVYGDDLIVPANEASSIIDFLEKLSLKVNRNKSFWNGKFRESCGGDYYDGVDVTPCYIRRDLPLDRTDSNGIISTVSTANQLFDAGYYRTAMRLKGHIESIVGKLPTVSRDSSAIGWFFYSEKEPPTRVNKDLQTVENRLLVPVTRKASDRLDGDHAMVKCFQVIGQISTNLRHLVESVGSYSLALKYRWVPSI